MSNITVLRMRWIGISILAVSIEAAAQVPRIEMQRQGPVRDQPQRFGTGAIKGRVVDGSSGAAIARARVRIVGAATQRAPVLTDSSGAFVFTNLPAGGYTLMAEKSTYLTARYPAGGRTIRSSSRPLILHHGEALDNVTVPLFRGAVIAGRVLDAHGDPMEYADVRVMRLSGSGGRPNHAASNSTNDVGEFRIPRLQEGRYLLMVTPRRVSPDEPPADAQPPTQPLPTYYPGAAAIDQAQPIVLEKGQTISGLDIMLAEGIPATVSGTIVGPRGERLTMNASVTARAIVKELPGFVDTFGGAAVRQDGTFRMTLAPGDYRIEARIHQPPHGGGSGPENELFGVARVSLASGGAESVSIVVGPGGTVSGRVVFEGTSPIPPVPGQFGPQFFMSEHGECRTGRTRIAADWTFRTEGLSGTCSVSPFGVGGWMLKAMLHDGKDLFDHPVTFEPGQDLRDIQAVLTDQRAQLTFRVADEQGQQTRDYVALVFPVAKERRAQGRNVRTYVPPSLEQMIALSSTTPMRPPPPEAMRGLAPGDYYAVAVDDIEMEASRDPDFLERLIPGATRIAVPQGSAEVSLRRLKLAGR